MVAMGPTALPQKQFFVVDPPTMVFLYISSKYYKDQNSSWRFTYVMIEHAVLVLGVVNGLVIVAPVPVFLLVYVAIAEAVGTAWVVLLEAVDIWAVLLVAVVEVEVEMALVYPEIERPPVGPAPNPVQKLGSVVIVADSRLILVVWESKKASKFKSTATSPLNLTPKSSVVPGHTPPLLLYSAFSARLTSGILRLRPTPAPNLSTFTVNSRDIWA